MDYAEFYYSQVVGLYPFDTDDCREQTDKVMKHLIDAGVSESDILRFIEESPPKDCLTPDDLPEWLWEGSLLKRNTFYYHNTLHIRPKAPTFNPLSKVEEVNQFYLEMKINYKMDDLINYFYETLRISKDLADKRKDEGSFNYLLNKYGRLDFCEAIDFVLALIDHNKPTNNQFPAVQNILDITQAQAEVYDLLKRRAADASLDKANTIHWR
ncbi:hypothetical protein [Bacillus atrophaeus]|uniref:hypothetical protein n=1 Tax=Bacillus atrophaeus TaxID=1452 RepID=UPI002E1EF1EC|nr:hypothetical protein [Bacillus atrophaeus]